MAEKVFRPSASPHALARWCLCLALIVVVIGAQWIAFCDFALDAAGWHVKAASFALLMIVVAESAQVEGRQFVTTRSGWIFLAALLAGHWCLWNLILPRFFDLAKLLAEGGGYHHKYSGFGVLSFIEAGLVIVCWRLFPPT